MEIREMTNSDINAILPLYISYYNEQENGCWTEETAGYHNAKNFVMKVKWF